MIEAVYPEGHAKCLELAKIVHRQQGFIDAVIPNLSSAYGSRRYEQYRG
jgi:hypothetical protein